MKRSPLIDLSEIHCLDVHELETFSGLSPEAWKAILNSVFPFPIVTFKENGVSNFTHPRIASAPR